MRLYLVGLLLIGTACASTPPAPPQPREATRVNASAGKTWNAVIDVLAARNIPIKTLERASGFVATDPLLAVRSDREFVDCGTVAGMKIPAARATYNVIVRGDSTASTVRATVRWTVDNGTSYRAPTECSSNGTWESAFELQVKASAEGVATAPKD